MSNSTLSLFDVQPTPVALPDLAEQINSEHRQCEAAMQSGLQHALQAGQLLTEAKKLCPHGSWLPWLKDNFEGSDRTAQSYMQIADRLDRMNGYAQRVADLSYREVLKLVAEPTPEPKIEVDPLPDLSPDFQYAGMSDDHNFMVEIYPADQIGYFHVAVFCLNSSESEYGHVDYDRRGVKYDKPLLAYALEKVHHVRPTLWHTMPKGEKPWYLTPEVGHE